MDRNRAQPHRSHSPPERPPARPKPLAVADASNKPSEDEFAVWCEHAVTRWVATAWAQAADMNRKAWEIESWHAGDIDPISLATKRAMATAFMEIINSTWSDYDRITGTIGQDGARSAKA